LKLESTLIYSDEKSPLKSTLGMDVVPVPPSGEDGGWADGLTGKGREVVLEDSVGALDEDFIPKSCRVKAGR
jgi:hypothetical protein